MTSASSKRLHLAVLRSLLLVLAAVIGRASIASATSVPSPGSQRLYWGALGGVYSANLDGSDQKKVASTTSVAWSVDIDPQTNKLYWSTSQPQRGIYSANLDGSQQHFIAPYSDLALRLSVDQLDNHLYWVDAFRDEIIRTELDGANPTVVFSQQIAQQKGMALGNVWSVEANPVDGTIFISGAILSYSHIWRTGRDFSSFTSMASWFENGTISPKEVAVDSATGDIYWTDEISEGLFRTTAPGVHAKIIPSGFPYVAHGLTVDPVGRKLYWTNQNAGTIYMVNLDGTGIQQIASGFSSIQGIVVGPAVPEPTSAILGSCACAFALTMRRLQHRHGSA
jgi:DNA-binding beta-propeller fold protein YncE